MHIAIPVILAVLLIYIIGIIVKKRFSPRARIYSFSAYEPEEGDVMHPARACSRYRFYHRLCGRSFLPRITSKFSWIPFLPNRIKIRDLTFRATATLWGGGDTTVFLEEPKGDFSFFRLKESAKEYPHAETAIRREDLVPTSPKDGGFLMKDGDVIVLREGTRYTFVYCFYKK